MVSKLIIVRSRSSSLRITSQRNDKLSKTKDPNQRQATARESLINFEDRKDELSQSLQEPVIEARSLRGRFVDGGEVRDCLSHAGWSQNHIDFLLYRSQHEHEKE